MILSYLVSVFEGIRNFNEILIFCHFNLKNISLSYITLQKISLS
jgi:hypothetical protein